ncbi:Uncharacterised protein [Leclercia adecarboxylata]|uniref:Uncharacterized protein n=1 Tax=Leclercia adecarboxylata TaxID=83655 RepID=A0A4U9HUT5_9ENTR|nr:Uncharacterised protein [Leclercia adecarboxylata]
MAVHLQRPWIFLINLNPVFSSTFCDARWFCRTTAEISVSLLSSNPNFIAAGSKLCGQAFAPGLCGKTVSKIIDNEIPVTPNSQPAKTDNFSRLSQKRNCPVSKPLSLPVVEPTVQNRFCMVNARIGTRRIERIRRGITIDFEEIVCI